VSRNYSSGIEESYRMEVQRVDRIYLISLSVAFESKVFTLLCIIQMMHTYPSFY